MKVDIRENICNFKPVLCFCSVAYALGECGFFEGCFLFFMDPFVVFTETKFPSLNLLGFTQFFAGQIVPIIEPVQLIDVDQVVWVGPCRVILD